MNGTRCKSYERWFVQIILATAVASCKPETHQATWCFQVDYIEGSPVDSAWLVLLEESGHSGNWQDGYTLEPLGDTLHTNLYGTVCIPAESLEGRYHLHAGVYDSETSDISIQHKGTWEFPHEESLSIVLPTPFWIQCVGGRTVDNLSESSALLMWGNEYPFTQQFSSFHSFTPGESPEPSLLIKGYIHPTEQLPTSRVWQAALSSPSGQLHPLPSLNIMINRSHLIDTTVVPQFW